MKIGTNIMRSSFACLWILGLFCYEVRAMPRSPCDYNPSLCYQIEPPLRRYIYNQVDGNGVEASEPYMFLERESDNAEGGKIGETGDIPLGIPDEEMNVPGEPLTPEDFENAGKIDLEAPSMDEGSVDPIEAAGLFEGDIAGVNASDIEQGRNAIRHMQKRWTRGVVPYVISASFGTYERSVIAAAFLDFQRLSCIRFVPRTHQRDYVYLLRGAGCSSLVGRSGGGQQVSLGAGCAFKGVVQHELLHALGFWHEQSRADRDGYVTVLWHNIQRGMEFNFQKFSWNIMQTLGMGYDTDSVMHYGMYSFSKDRRSPTILPNKPGIQFLGQRRGFSKVDVMKLNTLYECQRNEPTYPKPPTPVKPSKPGACTDNNRHCRYWANIGECRKNPAWMRVNCPVSCKECDACANYNKLCNRWAELGECTRNPAYMTIYCSKACHTCRTEDPGSSDCIDQNKYCEAWAKDRQCQSNPNYMLRFCKKSCRVC